MSVPAMSDERADLLQAIREEPNDIDLARIYADWLDDHGEPERAEYIRIRNDRDEGIVKDHDAELARRERALWQAHGKRWCEGLPREVGKRIAAWGFADLAILPASRFLAFADEIMRREPVGVLLLTGAAKEIDRLAGCPTLAKLQHLLLHDTPLRDAGCATL